MSDELNKQGHAPEETGAPAPRQPYRRDVAKTPKKPGAAPKKSAAAKKAPAKSGAGAVGKSKPAVELRNSEKYHTGTLYAAEVRAAAKRREAENPPAPAPTAPPPEVAAGQAVAGEPPAQPAGPPAQSPPTYKTKLLRTLRPLGNLLYRLGFAGEYCLLQVWRVVWATLTLLGQFLGWLLGRLWRGLLAGLKKIWRDLTQPFVRYRKRMGQLARLRERERRRAATEKDGPAAGTAYAGAGLKHRLALLGNVVGTLLPVAAALVFAVTVYGVLDTEYALAVEVDGAVLGHVTDKSVVESAKGLLRDRIRLVEEQELSDWQVNPDYKLGWAVRYTTAQQLANEMIRLSTDNPNDLVSATGLYINDTLFAVTTQGEALKTYLDDMLAGYSLESEPGAQVSFVKEVVCEPNEDDLFFAQSVTDFEELIDDLTAIETEEVRYRADGEEDLAAIAHAHNLTLETLLARNPQFEEEEAADIVPEAGTDLLLRRAQPFLQVQTSFRQQDIEPIPYVSEEMETDERPKGAVVTVQEGEDGLQQVWDDYVYIDGELEQRVRVDELTQVVKQPVDEVVEIGTKVTSLMPGDYELPEGGYGGSYMFPVPNSPYSSRGYSPGGHRGMDINAAEGTPIYACEGGTVTTAGWHWSWGNYIVIQHPGGVATLYAHCSALFVSAGQQVGQGTHIAAVGNTGVSFGSHLHLEITVNGALTDPQAFVGYPYG